MLIVEFFKENNLPRKIDFCTSKVSVYEDSETPIAYIPLPKQLPNGQMHLVCSRSLAEDIEAGKLTIKDAQVSLSESGTYGLIRPANHNVIATIELW